MGETGTVVGKDGSVLSVTLKRNDACRKCGACITFSSGEMLITAQDLCGASVGDLVEIELKSGSFLKAVLLMYALPCAFFVLGVFIGHILGSDAASAVTGSALAAAVYWFISKNRHIFDRDEYKPAAVKLIR